MPNLRSVLGEISGAFADLGTFLPIVLGVLSVNRMNPTGVLIGFGLFALTVAAVYRRPIPVQPMKVVAAVALAMQLSPAVIAASGVLLGVVLLALGFSGWIDRLAERVPQSLWHGLQMGIGLYLLWAGIKLMHDQWLLGIALILLLLLLQRTAIRSYAVLVIVGGFTAAALFDASAPQIHFDLFLPKPSAIGWQDLWLASGNVLLPQLALTLTNAVILTAAIARDLFPDDRSRLTPKRLALSTGFLNLLLVPFGAFPMCHGAGGLVVQHRFGARTGLAPAIFGASCLALGLFLGTDALKLLALIPLYALGALLATAGIALAADRKLRHADRGEMTVVLLTALGCVVLNVALGFLIGLTAEFLRLRFARKRN